MRPKRAEPKESQRRRDMRPQTEEDLAEAIKAADGPLRITGGGTRDIGRPVEGAALSTAGLSGITLYEPGALTLVAQAGTPLAEIEAALDAENQRLAFEPMDHRVLLGTEGVPTIGGVVAANVSGPRRIAVGACRDHMLGVRFVDGAGTVLKNGGRVMKNVTGYDLVKLMTGSYGTLGVLTEVSLKVLPKPETAATVMVRGLSAPEAVALMSEALGSPYEVTGAAHSPCGLEGTPLTALRLEGFEASVAYRSGQLTEMFKDKDVVVETDAAKVQAGWAMIRDCQTLKNADGDVWRISVRPSDAPAVLQQVDPSLYLLDWGGGLIWAAVPEGTNLRPLQATGHATLVRASAETRRTLPPFEPENATLTALSKGLRDKFDPRGILNTGLMA